MTLAEVWFCTFHARVAGWHSLNSFFVPGFCPGAVEGGVLKYAHECRGNIVAADVVARGRAEART